MLDVEYKGGNTVVLRTKAATVVVDPKGSVYGGKDIDEKGAVELATEKRFIVNGKNTDIVLDGPGEYEVKDFSIVGIKAQRHLDQESDPAASTIYGVEAGDINVAIIGNVTAPLSDDQLEAIGVTDIVVVPVGGGGYTLDATAAVSVVRSIDPKVVIPVHYDDPNLKYEVPQSGVEEFISEMGAPVEQVDKYKLKTIGALPESLTVVQLARTS